MGQWSAPELAEDELLEIERRILRAFETRTTHGLRVLGFGELGLAIGWPTDDPVMVVKRQAVGATSQVDIDLARMNRYHAALEENGLAVLPTELRSVRVDAERTAGYIVQPMVERHQLVEHILPTETPEADHPILVSIRDGVLGVVRDGPEGGLSVDAQVTNFAWDGEQVTVIDTTPPLIWDADGGPFYDVGNYLTAIPLPLRAAAMKITRNQGDRVRTASGALTQSAMFLLRIGLDEWVEPAIETYNARLGDTIERSTIDDLYKEAVRSFPLIKRMARLERFWQTKVRRRDYQFFITNSFSGDIL